MFAEDRFGRRMRTEREKRGMTQADVARVLEAEHGFKVHATAIAKMEQRDVSKPRVIRLSEAQAIANVFGLTVDEMMSDAAVEMGALAREFSQLGSQAQILRSQTAALLDRLRQYMPLLTTPAEEITPAIHDSRDQILQALSQIQEVNEQRRGSSESLLDEVWLETQRGKMDRLKALREETSAQGQPGLAKARSLASQGLWRRAAHRIFGLNMDDIAPALRGSGNETNIRISAQLEPKDGIGAGWPFVAMAAYHLWGHDVDAEITRRTQIALIDKPTKLASAARREALAEVVEEIKNEWTRCAPTVKEITYELGPIWGDEKALTEWEEAVIAEIVEQRDDREQ